MLYGSGNVLIRAEALARLERPQFDLRFNFLGGGDTDFFMRCRRAGLLAAWEMEGCVDEHVPPERMRSAWILRRGLRIGAINYLLERSAAATRLAALGAHAKTIGLFALVPWRFVASLARNEGVLAASHPLTIALGRLLAAFGWETEQYRAEES
jgi:hypothetical protein